VWVISSTAASTFIIVSPANSGRRFDVTFGDYAAKMELALIFAQMKNEYGRGVFQTAALTSTI